MIISNRAKKTSPEYEIVKGGKRGGKFPVYAVFGYQPGVGDKHDEVRIQYNKDPVEQGEYLILERGSYSWMKHMFLESAPESFWFNDKRKLIYSLAPIESFRYRQDLLKIPSHPFSSYYSKDMSEILFGVDVNAACNQLDRDSAAFLSRYKPKEQVSVSAEDSVSVAQDLLSGKAFCVGEFHNEPHAKDFFIYNMPLLKSLGYDTLYVENLEHDSIYQDLLDEYLSSPIGSKMPKSLELFAKSLMIKEGERETFYELIKAAKDCGVRVVGIDTVAAHSVIGPERYGRFAYTSLKIIEEEESLREKPGKYMMLVGYSHNVESFGIPGIPYLMGIYSFDIIDISRVKKGDGSRYNESTLSKNNNRITAVCSGNDFLAIEEMEKPFNCARAGAGSGERFADSKNQYLLVYKEKKIKDGKPQPLVRDMKAWKAAKSSSCAIL